MTCISNLYFYYDEKLDIIKVAHCCLDRTYNVLAEIPTDKFYNMSDDDFYNLLKSIAFTHPTECRGSRCECFWTQNHKIIIIHVAISKECNLSCPMCYIKNGHHNSQKRKKLYLDVIKKLSNFEFVVLKLTDWGEGFIYLDEILDIMKNYKYCKKMHIITNCTLVTEDLLKKIIETCEYCTLEVDIDALSSNIYERIRVGAKYSDFKKNLALILKYKKIYPEKLGTIIHFTEQDNNINMFERLKIERFAKIIDSEYVIDKQWFSDSPIYEN